MFDKDLTDANLIGAKNQLHIATRAVVYTLSIAVCGAITIKLGYICVYMHIFISISKRTFFTCACNHIFHLWIPPQFAVTRRAICADRVHFTINSKSLFVKYELSWMENAAPNWLVQYLHMLPNNQCISAERVKILAIELRHSHLKCTIHCNHFRFYPVLSIFVSFDIVSIVILLHSSWNRHILFHRLNFHWKFSIFLLGTPDMLNRLRHLNILWNQDFPYKYGERYQLSMKSIFNCLDI